MIYTVVIPTATEKHRWLTRTLFGLECQGYRPQRVLIGYDIKKNQSYSKPSYECDLPVEVIPFHFDNNLKHQHEIINCLVSTYTSPNDTLMIMDDDYWMADVCVAETLMRYHNHMRLTFIRSYFQVFGRFPNTNPTFDGNTISYFNDKPKKEYFSTLEENGHHNPFCGHPKLIQSKAFVDAGGFDTENFKHYWWCDTDFYYRLRERLSIVPIMTGTVFHVDHPRDDVQKFANKNRSVLDERYPVQPSVKLKQEEIGDFQSL